MSKSPVPSMVEAATKALLFLHRILKCDSDDKLPGLREIVLDANKDPELNSLLRFYALAESIRADLDVESSSFDVAYHSHFTEYSTFRDSVLYPMGVLPEIRAHHCGSSMQCSVIPFAFSDATDPLKLFPFSSDCSCVCPICRKSGGRSEFLKKWESSMFTILTSALRGVHREMGLRFTNQFIHLPPTGTDSDSHKMLIVLNPDDEVHLRPHKPETWDIKSIRRAFLYNSSVQRRILTLRPQDAINHAVSAYVAHA